MKRVSKVEASRNIRSKRGGVGGRKKGVPKTGGRKKGTPNKVTTEAQAAATALVDDHVYRLKLADDLRLRKVHPTIESMLWYYAKGKPKETVEHSGGLKVETDDAAKEAAMRRLSTDELRAIEAHYAAILNITKGVRA